MSNQLRYLPNVDGITSHSPGSTAARSDRAVRHRHHASMANGAVSEISTQIDSAFVREKMFPTHSDVVASLEVAWWTPGKSEKGAKKC